jgi:hypothetical protein
MYLCGVQTEAQEAMDCREVQDLRADLVNQVV